MSSKNKLTKEIKKEILSCDCNYDYIYDELKNNFEYTSSGIFNSFLSLFRNTENFNNKETLNNLILLLNNFVKDKNNKKLLNKLYNKIEIFLSNIGKSLDYIELMKLEKYISSLINIQNKCLINPMIKSKGDKYNFMKYLIFERRDVELLHKYMLDNMKEILHNNSMLTSIFMEIIENYIKIDEENKIEIKYYNQILNLFLKGKMYEKILENKNNEFMQVLKNSNKDFVWDLIDKIEGELFTTKEQIGKEYSVSFIFPKDLEVFTYSDKKLFDFTHQNIVTIDSEEDVCLDDALYIEKNNDGTYTFYIHLANPPSIIPYLSKTMKEALKRSETIYLPDMEVPIFEEYLSNNILSILPNKKTNTFTFVMVVDTDFSILLDTVRIIPGVVINKNKLSYEEVDDILRNDYNDELSNNLRLLSNVINRLSKDNLQITALHKVQNIVTGNSNTNSAKSDISASHSMVENSMTFANRLPYILDQYHNFGFVLPWRVQPECNEEYIKNILKNINNIDRESDYFKKIVRNYMTPARYSEVNIHHAELGINGYCRVSSPARRALDCLAQYALYDQYINRDEKDLDAKIYFWENEIKYWCEYANNRISENNIFISEYSYLRAKGKILEK
ncbi:MAG: RNB domain-containing ribonuclease [Bacilli bacterium]|nr:RNB domain-containing ribonuclease [Bacilli bacterium]